MPDTQNPPVGRTMMTLQRLKGFADDICWPQGVSVYLVGGPVRDYLLQLPVHDRDWLVVGATPEQMTAAGFLPVGKDFPVFLHPKTHEEYALARTERKQGKGYQGFLCYTSAEVTLEEDLLRRDFTINAMALDAEGVLHDPYGGRRDLHAGILRHVSPAFSEDPLRVLRAARFLARLSPLGFSVAQETCALLSELARSGELAELSAERVWRETERALTESDPFAYFRLLSQVGALQPWLTELGVYGSDMEKLVFPDQLGKVCAADADNASAPCLTDVALLRWGWLMQALSVEQAETLCQRLKVPRRYQEFSTLVARTHTLLNRALHKSVDAEQILGFMEQAGVFRDRSRFDLWLQLWSSPMESWRLWWQRLADQLLQISPQSFVQQGLKGAAIGQAIRQHRLQQITQALNNLKL